MRSCSPTAATFRKRCCSSRASPRRAPPSSPPTRPPLPPLPRRSGRLPPRRPPPTWSVLLAAMRLAATAGRCGPDAAVAQSVYLRGRSLRGPRYSMGALTTGHGTPRCLAGAARRPRFARETWRPWCNPVLGFALTDCSCILPGHSRQGIPQNLDVYQITSHSGKIFVIRDA